jgi:hypothetical protein
MCRTSAHRRHGEHHVRTTRDVVPAAHQRSVSRCIEPAKPSDNQPHKQPDHKRNAHQARKQRRSSPPNNEEQRRDETNPQRQAQFCGVWRGSVIGHDHRQASSLRRCDSNQSRSQTRARCDAVSVFRDEACLSRIHVFLCVRLASLPFYFSLNATL